MIRRTERVGELVKGIEVLFTGIFLIIRFLTGQACIHKNWCTAQTGTLMEMRFWPGLPHNYPKWRLKLATSMSSASSFFFFFVIFIKGAHINKKINAGRIQKSDASLKLVLWLTSYFSQGFPTTFQTCTKNGSWNWLLVGAPRPHWFIFIKGLAFTKIYARLKPVHWLIWHFRQAFSTSPQACTQNGVLNWLLVRAPRLHLFIFIKGLAFTKIDTRLKPVHWLIWFFSQTFPRATQAYIQNGVSNWLLVRAPRLHLFFFFFH
jgi:hypothetical protein